MRTVKRGARSEDTTVLGLRLTGAVAQGLVAALAREEEPELVFRMLDDESRGELVFVGQGMQRLELRVERDEGDGRMASKPVHELFVEEERRGGGGELVCVGSVVGSAFVEHELSTADRAQLATTGTVAENARKQRHSVMLAPAGKPSLVSSRGRGRLRSAVSVVKRESSTARLSKAFEAAKAREDALLSQSQEAPPPPPPPLQPLRPSVTRSWTPPPSAKVRKTSTKIVQHQQSQLQVPLPAVETLMGGALASRAEYGACAKAFRQLHARHAAIVAELRSNQDEFRSLGRELDESVQACDMARRDRAATRIRSLHTDRIAHLRAIHAEAAALAPALLTAKARLTAYATQQHH